MSEIRILNLCHKILILVDIYRQSLLKTYILHKNIFFGIIYINALNHLNQLVNA